MDPLAWLAAHPDLLMALVWYLAILWLAIQYERGQA